MKRKNLLLALAFFMVVLSLSCRKEDPEPAKGSVFVIVKVYGSIIDDAEISTEPATITTKTDLTGSAVLADIPIGGYKINATHPDIGSGSSSVTVIENTIEEVTIQLIVGAFEAPTTSINLPFDNAAFNLGEEIEFRGQVGDNDDAASLLDIEWSSNIDGVLSTNSANSQGNTIIRVNSLSEGEHIITLKATDSDGLDSEDQINLTIKKLPNTVTLNALEAETDGISLNWTVSDEPEFVRYKVRRAESLQGPYDIIALITNVNETTYVDNLVDFGVEYFYQIAVEAGGEESFSNIESSIFEGENIEVGVNIVRMKIDPARPYIYALDRVNNSLLFINKINKVVEKTIFVGSSPVDLAINLTLDKLYIANFGSTQIAVVDLNTQEKINDLAVETQAGTWGGNPHRIACIAGDRLVFTSEDQWNNFKLIDATTGGLLSFSGSIYEPGLITNAEQTVLYASESGSSGSEIIRYDLNGDEFVQVDNSDSGTNYGYRDACISTNNEYIFFNRNKYATNNLSSILGSFSEPIHACSSDGSIAIGKEYIWNANTFSIKRFLPLQSDIMVLDIDDKTIFIYDEDTAKIYIFTIP